MQMVRKPQELPAATPATELTNKHLFQNIEYFLSTVDNTNVFVYNEVLLNSPVSISRIRHICLTDASSSNGISSIHLGRALMHPLISLPSTH